jgi:integrase
MATLRLMHVDQFVDHTGTARFYFRYRRGKRIALPGLPGSTAFMQAYQAALASVTTTPAEPGASRTMAGTTNALVVAYYRSEDFTRLSPGTQQIRRATIERFRNQHGDKRVATLKREHLVEMLNAVPAGHARRNWFKALRGLLKFAVIIGMRPDDPSDRLTVKVPKSDGHHTWTDDEIAAYRAHWPIGTQQRLTLELALETTSRRADLTRIGPQHVSNGTLDLRHTKNHQNAFIPISAALAAAIAAMPTLHLTFLHTRNGAPRSSKALGGDFRQWCDQAGLTRECSLHGLRHAGATRLANAGATAHEIASFTGHKTLSEVERYTRKADRKRLAESAAAKLKVAK